MIHKLNLNLKYNMNLILMIKYHIYNKIYKKLFKNNKI